MGFYSKLTKRELVETLFARDVMLKEEREMRNELLERVPKILAEAIIEIIEPLYELDFQDLEKIARRFENKLNQLRGEIDNANRK